MPLRNSEAPNFTSDAIKIKITGLVITDPFFLSMVGATVFGVEIGGADARTRTMAAWLSFSVTGIILYERVVL